MMPLPFDGTGKSFDVTDKSFYGSGQSFAFILSLNMYTTIFVFFSEV